ncbi:FtsX-like permease family protein [Dactylosporangium salmoneum]|uniref:ABC transporter permease n=1 Tax=Dactylosporangium salmoneum TaxID=53361 RepID=A0ABN3FTG9_9ACTN
MIPFGLRLAVAAGRDALVRFVVLALAVTLGVGLLLCTVGGVRAVNGQFDRIGWMNPSPYAVGSADPVVWVHRYDYFDGHGIERIDVGATGPRTPDAPGLPRLPGPGEYYVSPALRDLIAANPYDQLAARFPGHQAGLIGDAALASPDSLVVVVGRTAGEVGGIYGERKVTSLSSEGHDVPQAALDLVLSVVAGGLLFPVLIFIGTATRLNATRREQRFAAMRLIGATPRQVSTLAAVESTAAAVIGTLLGFALFLPLRSAMAQYGMITGQRPFSSDISPGWLGGVLVAVGVPLAAAVAARLAMRRVRISPLGVARQVTPKPPSAWRLVPVLAGLLELAYFVGRRPPTSNGQTAAFLPGFLLIMVGLVFAGPWITMVGARFMARRARRLPTLVAARRLADNPRAAFRAISGVVLGLFVVSVATGVIGTIVQERSVRYNSLANVTMMEQFDFRAGGGKVPDELKDRLHAIPGVTFVQPLRFNPDPVPDELGAVIACADLARIPQYGTCAPGAEVVSVYANLIGYGRDRTGAGSVTVWPATALRAADLDAFPIGMLIVGLDGSTAAHERARTAVELAFPDGVMPGTDVDFSGDSRTQLNLFQQLADVIMLFSLPIAGCSLAVAVAAGLAERKRPFSLLRLTGVPLRALRQVVALESAVPLLAVAVLATGVGFAAAQLFLKAQMGYTLTPPGWTFYALAALGLLMSLGIIGSTLPLLERITGPETARND